MTDPAKTPAGALRLLFWETTARCNLACAHCRRVDLDAAPAEELSTDQARDLVRSTAALGMPIFVFSGGECLLRDDWEELAGCARQAGLPTALATNGTLIDATLAGRIARAGFRRVAVSLDAADAETHDRLRGRAGAFDAAVAGIHALGRAGAEVQVNATLAAANFDQLGALHDLARRCGAVALHLFVLVPVGCGLDMPAAQRLTAEQCESALEWVVARQADGQLEIKATCAPQYHRVARQWLERNAHAPGAEHVRAALRGRGCLAGTGILFVGHTGQVFPCGYLPVACGNVLETDLGVIWRTSEVLRRLRNDDLLTGKCGRCEFKAACGGCRGRAFAATGDFLAPDPTCLHLPPSAKR